MTENWQSEPSPWLKPTPDPEEPGPGSGDPMDPTAPQGLTPMRLHVNGDVVQIGPPMVDPPRLSPAAGPSSFAGPGPATGPAGISVPQIAPPIGAPQMGADQFAPPAIESQRIDEPQFSTPPYPPIDLPPPPPPPPFMDSSYGQPAPRQSPYSDAPYPASPYADKPLDNQPYVETPPPYAAPAFVEPARPEPLYTPEPARPDLLRPEPARPEQVYAPEPVRPEPIYTPEAVRPEPTPRYIEPTSIDSPTAQLPVAYVQPPPPQPQPQPPSQPQNSSQLTPVPHPSYQQHPAPPPPTGDPLIAGPADDGLSTMLVSVGTVQPRAPQPAATVEDAERVLGAAVDSLDADPDLYSIGQVTDGAVCLIPDDGRWAVFLADGGQRRYAGSFDDPMLAAVHFAGVLLLAAAERGDFSKPRPGPAALPGQSADPLAQFLAGPPIAPLAGDPPTTLYTDHRLTVLTPGTEVDRFGDQQGNTVYAARTRYPHRSLPPDYVEREYRVYRVRDPLRALAGTAIPWFGQPGGGTAYLLPRSIADLLREGVLVEIPAATVAPA